MISLVSKELSRGFSNTTVQKHQFFSTLPKVGPYSQSYGFSNSHVDVRVGPQRRLSAEELMLLNCGVGEAS